jgi:hypothetical protein
MGGKNDSPDYGDLAVQQGEVNEDVVRDQTYANRPDQYTPWGYTSWESNPYTDEAGNETTQWQQTQGLTPELQNILNQQIAIQGGRGDIAGMLTGRMGSEFGQEMNWDGLNPMGGNVNAQLTMPENIQRGLNYGGAPGVGDPYQTRQSAEDAVYNQAASRIDPRFASMRQNLEAKMRNQGIGPEDAAWKSQMEGLGQQENDARNQAMWSASGAGRDEAGQMFGQQTGLRNMYTGEQDRMGQFANQAAGQQYNQTLGSNNQNFNQSMQGSQYGNQIRQQQMTEAMQQRGFSLNEINALLSGQQVNAPNMPNFSQSGAAQSAPIFDAGVAQGNYDASQNPMGGLMDIAGQGLGGYLGRTP